MRIAHFSDCYSPRINGVTTSIGLLKKALEQAGHEVLLFVPKYGGAAVDEPGVYRMSSLYMPLQPEDRMGLPWPPARWTTLRQHVDVVHIHTPFAMGCLGLSKAAWQSAPMVFTHHTLWEEYAHYLKFVPHRLGRWVGRQLCDVYFRRAAAIVMPSQEVAEAVGTQRVRRPYRVIPTGIDCAEFRQGQAQQVWDELGLPDGSPLFLYMGRIGKEKSIDFLLRAFQAYRNQAGTATFVLLGGGPEREGLEKLAQQLGVAEHVRFLGYRPRQLLKHYLAATRLFLFASQTETQGLVLLEAAAAGVPVVAVRASGVNEAVEHDGSGMLVDPGDQDSFVAVLQRLDHDSLDYARLAERSCTWADTFSACEMGRKMVELYESLAPSRAGKAPSSEKIFQV